MTRRILLLLCGLALAAAPTKAQEPDSVLTDDGPVTTGRSPFQITPSIGVMLQDEASALQRTTGVLGLDFMYRLTEMIGVGFTGSVARPKTDGEFFPLVRIPAGDTSLYYRVSQNVVQYTFGIQGQAKMQLGRYAPYATASLGRYLFSLDPQAYDNVRRYGGPMFSLGAGVHVPLGSRAGMSVDLRDVIFTSFDRQEFDATDPLLRDPRFDPVPGGKPAAKSTIHNIRLTLGVSFIPAAREGTP